MKETKYNIITNKFKEALWHCDFFHKALDIPIGGFCLLCFKVEYNREMKKMIVCIKSQRHFVCLSSSAKNRYL